MIIRGVGLALRGLGKALTSKKAKKIAIGTAAAGYLPAAQYRRKKLYEAKDKQKKKLEKSVEEHKKKTKEQKEKQKK